MSEIIRCDVCEKEGTRLDMDRITRDSFATKSNRYFDVCTACGSQMFKNVTRYQMLVSIAIKEKEES